MGRKIWTGDVKAIRDYAMARGYTVVMGNGGHIRCTHASVGSKAGLYQSNAVMPQRAQKRAQYA